MPRFFTSVALFLLVTACSAGVETNRGGVVVPEDVLFRPADIMSEGVRMYATW